MASPYDKYARGKLLGAGSYGTATLFSTRDGKKVVIKEIDLSKLSPTDVKAAEGEVKVLQMLHNSNIVSCVESFRHQGKLCIVMDYCSEGDLQGALKRRGATPLPESTVIEWFAQICLGLKHVHDLSILHRDLKPGNIFMSSGGVLKLGDFGVSRVMDSPAALAKTMIGTPYYISPEITRCKPYNAKSDVWSLGCILYEMMTFRHPFNGRNTTELYRQIAAGVFPPIKDYSTNLKGLVAEMLAVSPNLRPSVNSILQKPFMQQHLREYLARLGIKDVAPPKAAPAVPTRATPSAALPMGSRPSAAALPAPAARVPVNLPVSRAPVPAAPPAARVHVEVRAPPAYGAPVVDMEKRRMAAQQAALALQKANAKEAQAQQAQVQARAQMVDRVALDAKKKAEAAHLMEALEADKKAKLVAEQERARKEAAAKLAEKALLNQKGRHERSAQLRAISQKHRREWSSGGQQEVQHEVFAPPMPARMKQPTPEPSPRQDARAMHAAHRISINEGPRRKVGFQEADPLGRTRSAPNSPRASPGPSPRPGGTPEITPPNSRGASPDRARVPGSHGISSDDRAKAYAESRAAAERNKRLVAEQEGLYYPQGGQGQGQSPAMFGAFPKAGSPSVDRTLRKIVSNREGGIGRHGPEEARAVRIDGAAVNKDLARSESSSSQDYEEMADMLQRMKTVAEDDCFQDAVDAENEEDEEPEEDESARTERMRGLREDLLKQLGPQKLDRVQHLLNTDCSSKAAHTRVELELGKILEHIPYGVIGKLRELNTYEADHPAPSAAAGKITPRGGR